MVDIFDGERRDDGLKILVVGGKYNEIEVYGIGDMDIIYTHHYDIDWYYISPKTYATRGVFEARKNQVKKYWPRATIVHDVI